MNIRLFIRVSIGLVAFATIFVFYNNSSYIFTIKKYSQPSTDRSQNDSYSDIDYYIRKMEDKYRKENKRIRKICDQYKSTLSFDFNNQKSLSKKSKDINNQDFNVVKNIWVDAKHRLSYCPIAKVKRIFLSILFVMMHINMENILLRRGNIVCLINF